MHRTISGLAAAVVATGITIGTMPHADAAVSPIQFRRWVVETKIPGTDPTSNDYLNRETIALYNISATVSYNLKGYVVYDRGNLHRYTFGSLVLRPHATVTLHTGKGTNSATHVYWNKTTYIWNNDGDTATLNGVAGGRIDYCTYVQNKLGAVGC